MCVSVCVCLSVCGSMILPLLCFWWSDGPVNWFRSSQKYEHVSLVSPFSTRGQVAANKAIVYQKETFSENLKNKNSVFFWPDVKWCKWNVYVGGPKLLVGAVATRGQVADNKVIESRSARPRRWTKSNGRPEPKGRKETTADRWRHIRPQRVRS